MRKLRFEHIEAQLTRQRFVSFRGDKLEAGTWINEATDKPRACHAVYINAFTGDPGLALQICPRSRQRHRRRNAPRTVTLLPDLLRFPAKPTENLPVSDRFWAGHRQNS